MRSLSILATAALAFLSTAHALLLVPRVSAPTCAQSCLTPGTVPFGNCSQNDKECLCKSPTYIQGVLNCITSSCTSQSDVDAAIFVPNALCQSLGITTIPAGVTTAAPGEPKTANATIAATSAAAPSKTGAASAPIGVNQPLVLFGAAAVAFGVAL